MGILGILTRLAGFALQYGPLVAPIIAGAEPFIVKGDWAGLATYLESFLTVPTPVVPAAPLSHIIADLRAVA
jgi:hypothetical protein